MRYLLLISCIFLFDVAMAQQLNPQGINCSGGSKTADGIILEDATGGLLVNSFNTSTFLYTQDILQPDGGTTTSVPVIVDVNFSGTGYGVTTAGTTFIDGSSMLEFTAGEFASITLEGNGNLLTQGILQPYNTGTALPVTGLALFVQRMDEAKVEVKWKTETEINNKGFYIERKKDNENSFTSIHFTPTAALGGNSSLPLQYLYYDNNNYTGKTLYRIKQEDNDGHSTYSDIRVVNGLSKHTLMKVWPIPSSGPVNVLVSGIVNTDKLLVIDVAGRVVQQSPVQNNSTIQINRLPPGTYIIRLAENRELLQKIIVQ